MIPSRIFLIAALCLLSATGIANAQRTTRRPLRVRQAAEAVTDSTMRLPLDTILSPGTLVIVSGYEKPLRSLRETMHVTNLDSLRPLKSLSVDIVYLDVDSVQVHHRQLDLDCDIPPGETKMIAFRSWDVQNRFYYIGGPEPRSDAYPFSIRLNVLSASYPLR